MDPTVSPVGLYPETSKGRNQYVTIGDKEVFSSNLINDARFTFTRSKMRAFVTGENPVLQFFSFYGENRQDGTVVVSGGPTPIGPSAFTPDFELQNVFSLNDDVFWVHGKHSFEIGAEFRRLQSPLANGFFEDQGWNFPSYASFIEGHADCSRPSHHSTWRASGTSELLQKLSGIGLVPLHPRHLESIAHCNL